MIGPLAQRHHVIAPDLRGHGQSEGPPGSTYSFGEMVGDVLHLLDHHHVESAHVAGLSAGGFLALQLALDQPARLRSEVVLGAAAYCDAHTRAVGQRWIETYWNEGYDAYILRLLKDLYYPDWIESHLDVADRLRVELEHRNLTGVLKWGEAVRSFDLRGRIGRIRVPTLVVQGMDDQVVDSSHARLLRQAIPGAELKLFASTGHMIPIERPDETIALIGDWISKSESRRTSPKGLG